MASRDIQMKWQLPPNTTPIDDCELPQYKPALCETGKASYKHELTTPFTRAVIRTWLDSEIEINNTQLVVRTTNSVGVSKSTAYSLQYAEVGLATDYKKKANVLRIRAEAQQFLLAFRSIEECIRWLIATQMAIDLSLPLDLRPMPELMRNHRYHLGSPELILSSHGYRITPVNSASEKSEKSEKQGGPALSVGPADLQPEISQDVLVAAMAENDTPAARRRAANRLAQKYDLREYRHLRSKSSWQGKFVLYKGRWSVIDQNTICNVLQ